VQGATLDGGHERGALGGGKAAGDPERVLVVAPPSERAAAVGVGGVGRADDLGVPGQMLELRRGHSAGLLGDLARALFRRRSEEAQEGTQLVPAEAALPEGRSRVGQLGQPVGEADHLGGMGVAHSGTEGEPVGHGPGAVGPPRLTAVEGGDQPADRRPQRGLGREQLADGLGQIAVAAVAELLPGSADRTHVRILPSFTIIASYFQCFSVVAELLGLKTRPGWSYFGVTGNPDHQEG
jgi:hypothetical protein